MPEINENSNEEMRRSRQLKEVKRRLEGKLEEGEYGVEIIEKDIIQAKNGKKPEENRTDIRNKNENKEQESEENQATTQGHKMPKEKNVPAQEPEQTEEREKEGMEKDEDKTDQEEKGMARRLKGQLAEKKLLTMKEARKAGEDIPDLKKLKQEKSNLEKALELVTSNQGLSMIITMFEAPIDTLESVDGGTIVELIMLPIKLVIFVIKIKNIVGALSVAVPIVAKIKVKIKLIYIIAFFFELIPFINALPINTVADLAAYFIHNNAIRDINKQIEELNKRIKNSTALLGR